MGKNTYTPNNFEEKWQKYWEENKFFQNTYNQKGVTDKNKQYLLFAFAYPSGSGLHVGHVESKTALDIMARFSRMNNKKVFFPVGWDAFGLPAENYAVKTGVHPSKTTKDAIKTFKRQIKRLGISYDWETEVNTSSPDYYKWTQWIFSELYKDGLAYKKKANVNWCPSCQTVLANEQVVDGKCERCGSEVLQKQMDQWFYKITNYKEELVEGLKQIDWHKFAKDQQLNWIGKSVGATIIFKVDKTNDFLSVFTTRPDTIFGATFMVIAPEHKIANKILKGTLKVNKDIKSEVTAYVKKSINKTDLQRQTSKTKTGVFSGLYAINPANNKKIPIYIADYVLGGYGTGAIMAVPAHDERDFEFAKSYSLPITKVVKCSNDKLPYTEEGVSVNSNFLNGLNTKQAKQKIINYLKHNKSGKKTTTFRLRDWLISRQRYWGVPIPVVYDPKGNPHLVKEEHLPWTLPTDVDFKPTGESPLKSSKEFKQRVEKLYGKGWYPEYDTMDTFVDSSWYFMRYSDPKNKNIFASKEQLNKWLPVDLYIIGPEHIVLHLLYSRFFTKYLRDKGYIKYDEFVKKLRHQGMILGPDGKKMSKSKGNVISPDTVVQHYGADTLRMYEMFMGPFEDEKPWNENTIAGVYRFLSKVYTLSYSNIGNKTTEELKVKLHKTIKKVQKDIPALKFNTAIAFMMEFVNLWSKETLSKKDAYLFIQCLSPFAPFLAEEINFNVFKNNSSIHLSSWPKYDKLLTTETKVTLPIQVNGKVRGELTVGDKYLNDEEHIFKLAKEQVASYLQSPVKKQIYINKKIVSFVV